MNAHCGTALFVMLFSFASAPAFCARLLQRLHSSQLGRASLRRGPALLGPMPASLRRVAPPPPTPSSRAARGIPLLLCSYSRPTSARLPLIVHALAAFFPFSCRGGFTPPSRLPLSWSAAAYHRFAVTTEPPTVPFRADLTPSYRVCLPQANSSLRDEGSLLDFSVVSNSHPPPSCLLPLMELHY
jgi:hypothetical protein